MKVTPNELHAVRYALGNLIHHAFDTDNHEQMLRDLYIAAELLELLKKLAHPENLVKEKT